jgi:MSHA pilin protein MshD
MNTGQMLVTLGALTLLTTLLLGINRGFSTSGSVLLQSKCGIAAVSLAVTKLASMNAPSALGPKSGEVYPNFNDFDDYNGFKDTVFSQLPDSLFVNCTVVYVDPANPNVTSTTQTWHKKLTVAVTSRSLKDTVKMNYIFSYWYYR